MPQLAECGPATRFISFWWTNRWCSCYRGYLLAPPTTTVDSNRPAYGGTCYSPFALSQTVTVTAYNSTNVTATAEWIASTTGAQAYAHPIDGFALDAVVTSVSHGIVSTCERRFDC
jgi:hypothetical protein